MKNLCILGPLGLLIICALIDKSKSLPALDLRDGAVETIMGDTKDDGKCSGANIILADGHVGHNTDLSSKIEASNDGIVGAQCAEPKGKAGLGTEHAHLSTQKSEAEIKVTSIPKSTSSMQHSRHDEPRLFPDLTGLEGEPDMVLPFNAVETKEEFFDTAEQFPGQESSSTSGQSSRTSPMIKEYLTPDHKEWTPVGIPALPRKNQRSRKIEASRKMKEKPPQDVRHPLEGSDKNILPGEDSSSLSDQSSKTNTMIEDDFTPTPNKIIEKEKAKNSRHVEPRLLPNLARLEAGSDMALPSHTVEKQEKFFDAAERFAPRRRRKKPRPVKKDHFEEIENTFPGDWELEEENTNTHPIAKSCKTAFIVSLIGTQALALMNSGPQDPLAKLSQYQGHHAAWSGRNNTPWIGGDSASTRGTLSIA